MSLITLHEASLSFGPQAVLEGASLRIGAGEKIGLVGPNGSGKSTLLKVLMGRQGLDSGRIERARGCRVGYLPQDVLEVGGGSVLGSVLDAVPGRATIADDLTVTRRRLEASEDPDEQMRLSRVLADLTDRQAHFESTYSEHAARAILRGLGFSDDDLDRPTGDLSGGWKMRAALAGLLFQQPDVLFLDEPTNHLDVPSVIWLDGFLSSYRHALLLICHDRAFFNRQVARVVAFTPEGVRHYRGNYDDYLAQREAEEQVLEARARTRERKIRELDRFVTRFKAQATKARQAQSKARQIEKLQAEIERPVAAPRKLSFSFPKTERTGRNVLVMEGVSKAFGDLQLYRGLSRAVYAGERVAIIGANGRGKSTLLKIMAGELAPDEGEVKLGSGVKPGYFAQHHTDLLDRRRTVLEEVWRVKPDAGESRVRSVCGAFLFSGDDVDKPVAVLSGGERARVLLARLLLSPGNLLLLDEPTTHLDVHAAEELVGALCDYDGTLVLVSHNTELLSRLPTRIWDLAGGELSEYPGNFEEYREHLRRRGEDVHEDPAARGTRPGLDQEQEQKQGQGQERKPELTGETREERKERKRREAEQRNAVSRATRDLRRAIAALEAEVEALEEERDALDARLADPSLYEDRDDARRANTRHGEVTARLAVLYQAWADLQEELEEKQAEVGEAAEG